MSAILPLEEMPKSCGKCDIKCRLYSKNSDRFETVHPQCPLQDTNKLVILNKEQTTELLEVIEKLQSKLNKIEEVVDTRLFQDYISDVEITIIKQILGEPK
jgi:predicted RND superfamily exporter protein